MSISLHLVLVSDGMAQQDPPPHFVDRHRGSRTCRRPHQPLSTVSVCTEAARTKSARVITAWTRHILVIAGRRHSPAAAFAHTADEGSLLSPSLTCRFNLSFPVLCFAFSHRRRW